MNLLEPTAYGLLGTATSYVRTDAAYADFKLRKNLLSKKINTRGSYLASGLVRSISMFSTNAALIRADQLRPLPGLNYLTQAPLVVKVAIISLPSICGMIAESYLNANPTYLHALLSMHKFADWTCQGLTVFSGFYILTTTSTAYGIAFLCNVICDTILALAIILDRNRRALGSF